MNGNVLAFALIAWQILYVAILVYLVKKPIIRGITGKTVEKKWAKTLKPRRHMNDRA